MIRVKKILSFIVILNCLSVSAQNETGAALFKKKINQYCSTFPREEIYVHTDRSRYISGETLWFNVFAVERLTLKPSGLSRIAYVELLNYDDRPVMRKNIFLEGGSGPGDISLPDTLSSGIYTLRAYTSWMKNFLPENCFRKEIIIYNAVSSNTSVKRPAYPGKEAIKKDENPAFPGFQIQADNSKPDKVGLLFKTDSGFRSSVNSVCYLIIETRGNVSVAEDIKLTGEETQKFIPKTLLLPGVNHIALLTASGSCIAQKFIYIPPSGKQDININCGDTYSTREKLSLEINTGRQITKNLSVSVIPVDADQFPDFSEYMVFGSEYGNEIVQKAGKLGEMQINQIDSLLLDASSSYLDLNFILSGKVPDVKYYPEKESHYLRGKLVNSNEMDRRVIMSIPGKKAIFQYAEADKSGNFIFELPVDDKMREIIIEPDDVNGKSTIKIESPFSEDYIATGHRTDTVKADPGEPGVNYQVQKIYGIMDSGPGDTLPVKTIPVKRFYGKPDIELVLADYIKLPTMDEIFFEIIPGTTLKQRKTGYEITVSDPVTNLVYDHPPSLFIDGVRISNAGTIADLDPEYVEEIDVMRERYYVGDYMFTGIVNVITKAGDFKAITLPEFAVRTYYRVIDPVHRFISADYSSVDQKKSRIPDFRNTLWWSSRVTPGKSEFWSSDIPGEYKIIVNGISEDGTPMSAERIIRIK